MLLLDITLAVWALCGCHMNFRADFSISLSSSFAFIYFSGGGGHGGLMMHMWRLEVSL